MSEESEAREAASHAVYEARMADPAAWYAENYPSETPGISASGVAWDDYGDYLVALDEAGYDMRGDDPAIAAEVIGAFIYAPALKETEAYVEDNVMPQSDGALAAYDKALPVSTAQGAVLLTLGMAGGIGDNGMMLLPGEAEEMRNQVAVSVMGETGVNVRTQPVAWFALLGLFKSIFSGSFGGIMAALAGLIAGLLSGGGSTEQALYIGNRLAGIIKGDITQRASTGSARMWKYGG